MYFVTRPKQGLEMEAVVLHRVAFLEYFCPKQGQDFKPSAAPLYPNLGHVPLPPGGKHLNYFLPQVIYNTLQILKTDCHVYTWIIFWQ